MESKNESENTEWTSSKSFLNKPKKHSLHNLQRLLTVKIPASRRKELKGVNFASSAVVWAQLGSAILLLAYAITEFCLPVIASGIVGLILSIGSIYLCFTTYNLQEAYEGRLVLLAIGLFLVSSSVILGLDSATYAQSANSTFPNGCLNGSPDDVPNNLTTTCSRYKPLGIAALSFISVVCFLYILSFIYSVVLVRRLAGWEEASKSAVNASPPTSSSSATAATVSGVLDQFAGQLP